MKRIRLLIVLLVLAVVGGFAFIYSGIFNVSAKTEDSALLRWLLHTTMAQSVAKRSREIEVPDLGAREMILAGLSDYVAMCARCHGEPGEPEGILARGLNPAPPKFEHLTEAGTAAEKFWIINNGIRMTGMPAFGNSHEADNLWPVVAFLQSAEGITPDRYRELKEEAKGHGHHDHMESSQGPEESTHVGDTPLPQKEPSHTEHDHSHDHQHDHSHL